MLSFYLVVDRLNMLAAPPHSTCFASHLPLKGKALIDYANRGRFFVFAQNDIFGTSRTPFPTR